MGKKLRDDLGTAVLALVLALVVWVNATYQSDRPREDFFPEPIPIEVLNAPAGLIVTNTPEVTVKVRIRAFASSWSSLTVNSFKATVDWAGLGPGDHVVPVKVTCFDRTVTVLRSQPETIRVQLEPLKKEAFEVVAKLEDKDEIPLGYAVEQPEITPRFVVVEGPASAVERVESLVASVFLLGQRTAVERVVEPRPLDKDGRLVKGVTLTPATVTVRLDVQKQLNYREVAVVARTKGVPARGYYVSSVEVTPPTVTVVGPPAVIANMPSVVSTKGEINLTGATRMIAERLELNLPEGVSVLTEGQQGTQQVLVTVGIAPVIGGTTVQLSLQPKRLREGLVAKLSISSVDVILTGPAVLLDDLNLALLDAYVDLNGLDVGTHQVRTVVDILVARNPSLADLQVTSISPAFVEVTITAATPTPTATPTAPPTVTPTGTITPLAGPATPTATRAAGR